MTLAFCYESKAICSLTLKNALKAAKGVSVHCVKSFWFTFFPVGFPFFCSLMLNRYIQLQWLTGLQIDKECKRFSKNLEIC